MELGQHKKKDINRAKSALSVSGVDYYLNYLPKTGSPPSPALSTLTLTPGRLRNIDQDMESLRASRQDNPFIQKVIASRESLLDSCLQEESDDVTLMPKELSIDLDADPLNLPEMHEHMIRSPPPISWPRSSKFQTFQFPDNDDSNCFQDETKNTKEKSRSTELKSLKYSSWNGENVVSPMKSFKAHYYQDPFTLLTSNSLRSTPHDCEDNIHLIMGED